MAIIRYTKDATIKYAYLNIFPDQFKTDKQKKDESWIKNTMDYFSNKAYAEYMKHRDTFVKNYDLLKGILKPEDFYHDAHRLVYQAILDLSDKRVPADLVTLTSILEDRKKLKEIGLDVKKNQIILAEPIKELGEFPVKIRFSHNLEVEIKVIVTEEKE